MNPARIRRALCRSRTGGFLFEEARNVRYFGARRGGPRNWIGSPQDPEETSPEKLAEISLELKSEAKRLGLSVIGVTSPRPSSRFKQYEEWLQNNYHGELDYMARDDRIARRKDPQLILPGAKSVIMVGLFYWPGKSGFPDLHEPKLHSHSGANDDETLNRSGSQKDVESRGIVSSYAWGDDYHKLMEKRLKALGKHLNSIAGGVGRFYVDTGAILERDFAERAGLGFVGKNSLVIDPRRGSGFFIGELFSTIALPFDGDEDRGVESRKRGSPGCGKCVKCRVACPTGAIVEDHVVDARKCISYLTIELKGTIPEELRKQMGNRIYGCDICQQVCPWNRVDWIRPGREDGKEKQGLGGYSPLFGYVEEEITSPKLVELLQMDEETFQERFKGTAVRRIGRERMSRNAAVGLGNVGGMEELQAVRQAAEKDGSEIVREHAAWAARRMEQRLRRQRCRNGAPEVRQRLTP